MKIRNEERVTTTKIVEVLFELDEVKEALINYWGLTLPNSTVLADIDGSDVAIREYDAEIEAPSVTIYAWKEIQDGEY